MDTHLACLVAIVVLLVVFIAWSVRNSSSVKSYQSPLLGIGAAAAGPQNVNRVERERLSAAPVSATLSLPAPLSAQLVVPPSKDFRSRNGHYIDPARLAEAEQQAWTPSNPYAAPSYDPTKDVSPGDSLAQSTDAVSEGDWNQRISDFGVDAQTRKNHIEWADNVGPFSQTAMVVDDLDEAVALSSGAPRWGITTFRSYPVPQGPCTQTITEIGPADQDKFFKKFDF